MMSMWSCIRRRWLDCGRMPALPGCVSQGKDEKEALVNIREAIAGWLGGRPEGRDSLPAGQMPVLVAV